MAPHPALVGRPRASGAGPLSYADMWISVLLAVHALAAPDLQALQAMHEDVRIARILDRLRHVPVPQVTIVRNVRVVDPVEGSVTPGRTVAVVDGRIAAVVDTSRTLDVPNAMVIDGRGRFLSPGLADMHVHSHWASAWLLDLANGVTTVREMAGFPWLLDVRAHVESGRMLAPTLFVAGTIINAFDMGGFAVVPRDRLDARRIVRQQAACGYDFIKVHNMVPRPIFDAIADEAGRLGMDMVGHVPHDIHVREAVDHGMRTMEHLKGFLDDKTLQMGDTDYVSVANPKVWITPTLYAGRGYAPAESLRVMLDAPEMRYVPARRRQQWSDDVDRPRDHSFQANVHGEALRRQITRSLAAVPGVQFLAGTDAAFYPYQVMGFALVGELQLLAANGLSSLAAVRAATTAPAAAMHVPESFGRISVGMRADLVLLDANPLADVAAYRHNAGVMVRGRWLERATIDSALAQLAEIYAAPAPAAPTRQAASVLVAESSALADSGFVFGAPILLHAAEALRHAGFGASADSLTAIADAPTQGPCAAPVPQ